MLEQYESANLSQKVFCERHELSLSTFHAKRQQLRRINETTHSGFVQAEIVETRIHYQASQPLIATMTLSVNCSGIVNFVNQLEVLQYLF